MANKDKKTQDVDPSRLDNVADEKYPASFQQTTDFLKDELKDSPGVEDDDFGDADDGVSSSDEEGALNDEGNNVSEDEAEDLEQAASRMPDEDDILDQDFLDERDMDGTSLNESDEPMGDDLDISPEDEDANIFDDNE